jgi:hypothetical protein
LFTGQVKTGHSNRKKFKSNQKSKKFYVFGKSATFRDFKRYVSRFRFTILSVTFRDFKRYVSRFRFTISFRDFVSRFRFAISFRDFKRYVTDFPQKKFVSRSKFYVLRFRQLTVLRNLQKVAKVNASRQKFNVLRNLQKVAKVNASRQKFNVLRNLQKVAKVNAITQVLRLRFFGKRFTRCCGFHKVSHAPVANHTSRQPRPQGQVVAHSQQPATVQPRQQLKPQTAVKHSQTAPSSHCGFTNSDKFRSCTAVSVGVYGGLCLSAMAVFCRLFPKSDGDRRSRLLVSILTVRSRGTATEET